MSRSFPRTPRALAAAVAIGSLAVLAPASAVVAAPVASAAVVTSAPTSAPTGERNTKVSRFRVGVAGGAEHGDEQLDLDHLASRSVDHLHGSCRRS